MLVFFGIYFGFIFEDSIFHRWNIFEFMVRILRSDGATLGYEDSSVLGCWAI